MIKLNARRARGRAVPRDFAADGRRWPMSCPTCRRMVGETLDIVIGVGPGQNAYLAAGRDAMEDAQRR